LLTLGGNVSKYLIKHDTIFPLTSLFENVLSSDAMLKKVRGNMTPINIYEEHKEYVIEIAIPGICKKHLKLLTHTNTLKVIYEPISEEKSDRCEETSTVSTPLPDRVYFKKEFEIPSFERTFEIPKNIDSANIKSAYVDGVLIIHLPKVEVEVFEKEISIL